MSPSFHPTRATPFGWSPRRGPPSTSWSRSGSCSPTRICAGPDWIITIFLGCLCTRISMRRWISSAPTALGGYSRSPGRRPRVSAKSPTRWVTRCCSARKPPGCRRTCSPIPGSPGVCASRCSRAFDRSTFPTLPPSPPTRRGGNTITGNYRRGGSHRRPRSPASLEIPRHRWHLEGKLGEGLREHVTHPVGVFHHAAHDQRRRGAGDSAVTRPHRGGADDVRQAGLVL